MRLPCDVEIQNRMLPSHGMIKRGRSIRASIVIGRRPLAGNSEGGIFLAICTAKDRDGAKYCLKGNVVKIFGRFVQEGKATIRIHEPAQDVCISKADPLQLKVLLTAVNLAHRDQDLPNVQLSSLVPAKQSQVERPKTNVVIHRRQDYPITTGFPQRMEFLQVNGCSLKKVDSRILKAKHLKRLDLSSNSICEIPGNLDQLTNLSELNFSHNQLQYLPVGLCKSLHLVRTLQCLNISHNHIKHLPFELVNLARLVRLDISHNSLETLPDNFGKLHHLRFLNMSGSDIKFVPSSFSKLRLEELDLSGCDSALFAASRSIDIPDTPKHVPKLVELAGRTVITAKLPFTEGDIPVTLCFYLSPSRWHWCFQGTPISVEGHPYGTFAVPMDLSQIAHTVTSSDFQRRAAPILMKGYFCSYKCQVMFTGGGYAR
ncbi:leucine-rich repeat protein 1-like [Strongylocentrotus purpuratus]|uniref:PIF1/LRR1 pleckstrin homology domain-containing protein n=1 Tax=Strongylocentrotus purpuratus TaxID=7668 RepID=A0A7M7PP04_STRPU|nr:leucine-rich repeat protein 1-like [Strongylocentrotus purpuratus]